MNEPAMLSCREAIEQLWAYIDGELAAGEADRVHEHLHACSACSPQHDYQRAFREFLRTQSREQAPPELRRRIFLRLLGEAQGEAS